MMSAAHIFRGVFGFRLQCTTLSTRPLSSVVFQEVGGQAEELKVTATPFRNATAAPRHLGYPWQQNASKRFPRRSEFGNFGSSFVRNSVTGHC